MLGDFYKKLFGSPVAKILVGSAGGQGILLLASPLLTRLYSPTDFGSLAVLTALSAVLGVIATLRWEAGVVLPRRNSDARALGWLALCSALFFSLLTGIIVVVWPATIEVFAGSNAASIYWWLLPLTIMSIAIHKVLSSWMVRQEQFVRLGQRNFLVGIGQLLVQVGFGLAGVKPVGLLLGLAGGRLAGTGGAFGIGGFFGPGLPRSAAFRRVAQRYSRFPLVSSWSAAVNSLGLQAPVLLLSAFYGGVSFGLLALTMRVLTAPVGVISDAVSQHFESAAAKALRTGRSTLVSLLHRTVLRQLIAGAIPVALVLAFGPWLFETVFGDEWRVSGVYAQILVIGYYCQFIVSPVSKTLLLLELHGRQAAWDFTRAAAVIGGISACALLNWDLLQACIIMAVIQVLGYTVLLMSVIHAVKKRHRYAPRHLSEPGRSQSSLPHGRE